MKPFLLALALLFVQPAPMTIADCLLASGYSRAVPSTPVTMLTGVDAWATDGVAALTEGEQVGSVHVVDSDGTRRMIWFYAYAGSVYAFVFKAENDPARRLPGEAADVWHGDCFIRLTSAP